MSDIPYGKRIYRNLLSDSSDQYLFFGLFGVGGLSIWLLRTFGVAQTAATIITVGLIFLYAAIALVTKRYRIREDRVGDNCYYLGFLFTLVSLAYALHTYDPTGAGASDIIANFGIAIFTTIVGLALRVLFNQMREDPVEYEREARYSLAEASSMLRAQLNDISTDMADFKRRITQITEEGVVDIVNHARASMNENALNFSDAVKRVLNEIEHAFEFFTSYSSRLNDITSGTVTALEALFARIEAVEAPTTLISSKLDPIARKFEEIADEIGRRNRAQTSDLKRLRDMIDAALKAAEALGANVSASETSLTRNTQKLMETLTQTLGSATDSASELVKSSQEFASQIALSQKASDALAESISIQVGAIAKTSAAFDSELQVLTRHKQEMTALAAESRTAVREVQSGLISLSNTIVEQLGSDQRAH